MTSHHIDVGHVFKRATLWTIPSSFDYHVHQRGGRKPELGISDGPSAITKADDEIRGLTFSHCQSTSAFRGAWAWLLRLVLLCKTQ